MFNQNPSTPDALKLIHIVDAFWLNKMGKLALLNDSLEKISLFLNTRRPIPPSEYLVLLPQEVYLQECIRIISRNGKFSTTTYQIYNFSGKLIRKGSIHASCNEFSLWMAGMQKGR